MAEIVPPTTTRVERGTREDVDRRIRRQTRQRVARYARAGPEILRRRLDELDHEWDIERAIEANAALVSLAGLLLGRAVSRRWYVLPAVAAAFLFQHAVQGWCPPLEWFRRMGVRTPREIEQERRALQAVRRARERARSGRHACP